MSVLTFWPGDAALRAVNRSTHVGPAKGLSGAGRKTLRMTA